MPSTYEFAIDVAFKIQETQQPDGEHYLLEWATAQNPGTGWVQLPPQSRKGSGGDDYTFGDVEIHALQNDGFVVSIFSNDPYPFPGGPPITPGASTIQSVDWVRLVSRPAHDALPNTNPPISPLQGNGPQSFAQGAMVPVDGTEAFQSAPSAGFNATFNVGFGSQLSGQLAAPPAQGEAHYEVEVYLGVTNGAGEKRFYKSDPELIIGKRGN